MRNVMQAATEKIMESDRGKLTSEKALELSREITQ